MNSVNPEIIVPKLTGRYNINEYFNAVLLSKPLSKQATSVIPLLDIPGAIATAWYNPIAIASLNVISLSFFVPSESFANNKAIAVTKNPIPTKKIFLAKTSSSKSLVKYPNNATGIVQTTSNQQYLNSS